MSSLVPEIRVRVSVKPKSGRIKKFWHYIDYEHAKCWRIGTLKADIVSQYNENEQADAYVVYMDGIEVPDKEPACILRDNDLIHIEHVMSKVSEDASIIIKSEISVNGVSTVNDSTCHHVDTSTNQLEAVMSSSISREKTHCAHDQDTITTTPYHTNMHSVEGRTQRQRKHHEEDMNKLDMGESKFALSSIKELNHTDVLEAVNKISPIETTVLKRKKTTASVHNLVSGVGFTMSQLNMEGTDARITQSSSHIKFLEEGELERSTCGIKSQLSSYLQVELPSHDESHSQFSQYPKLKKFPKKKYVIAFRHLELSQDYTPEISPYKFGRVVSTERKAKRITIDLDELCVQHRTGLGKFDLPKEVESNDENQENHLIELNYEDLIEPKLISKKG